MIPRYLSQIPGWKGLPENAVLNGDPYRIPSLDSLGGGSSRGSHRLSLGERCGRALAQRYASVKPMPDATAQQNPTALKGSWFHALAAGKVLGDTDERAIERGLAENLPREMLPLPKAAMTARWDALNAEIMRFDPQWQLVECELAATIGELWPEDFFVDPRVPNEIVTSRFDRIMFKQKGGQLFIHVVDYKTKKAAKLYALKPRDHHDPQAVLNMSILRARFPGAAIFFSHCRISMQPPHEWDLKLLTPPERLFRGIGVECERAVLTEQEILSDPSRSLAFEGFLRGTCHGSFGGYPCDWLSACFESERAPSRLVQLPLKNA